MYGIFGFLATIFCVSSWSGLVFDEELGVLAAAWLFAFVVTYRLMYSVERFLYEEVATMSVSLFQYKHGYDRVFSLFLSVFYDIGLCVHLVRTFFKMVSSRVSIVFLHSNVLRVSYVGLQQVESASYSFFSSRSLILFSILREVLKSRVMIVRNASRFFFESKFGSFCGAMLEGRFLELLSSSRDVDFALFFRFQEVFVEFSANAKKTFIHFFPSSCVFFNRRSSLLIATQELSRSFLNLHVFFGSFVFQNIFFNHSFEVSFSVNYIRAVFLLEFCRVAVVKAKVSNTLDDISTVLSRLLESGSFNVSSATTSFSLSIFGMSTTFGRFEYFLTNAFANVYSKDLDLNIAFFFSQLSTDFLHASLESFMTEFLDECEWSVARAIFVSDLCDDNSYLDTSSGNSIARLSDLAFVVYFGSELLSELHLDFILWTRTENFYGKYL